jgi:hypothetical protein
VWCGVVVVVVVVVEEEKVQVGRRASRKKLRVPSEPNGLVTRERLKK